MWLAFYFFSPLLSLVRFRHPITLLRYYAMQINALSISDGLNAQYRHRMHVSGSFEHKPVRSLSFLNGNRGLSFFALHSLYDSLGRLPAASQCTASNGKDAVQEKVSVARWMSFSKGHLSTKEALFTDWKMGCPAGLWVDMCSVDIVEAVRQNQDRYNNTSIPVTFRIVDFAGGIKRGSHPTLFRCPRWWKSHRRRRRRRRRKWKEGESVMSPTK